MRVHVEPAGLYSRAMVRIAQALERHAPAGVSFVRRREDADLCVLYAIGLDQGEEAIRLRAEGKRVAIVQCCLETSGGTILDWIPAWKASELVWSYYDLSRAADFASFRFYGAPLGIDPAFVETPPAGRCNGRSGEIPSGPAPRAPLSAIGAPGGAERAAGRSLVLTTGYVSAPGAEAIQEVWTAAEQAGLAGFHVGPREVAGTTYRPASLGSAEGISDEALAGLYDRSLWVAALRCVEGFEMPAAEGLARGARPVLFDQPALRWWYGEHAVFVPECSGTALVDALREVFASTPEPVSEAERRAVLTRFSWERIASGFWAALAGEDRACA